MNRLSKQDTARTRQEIMFQRYTELIKEHHRENPEITKALSKSYFYNKIGDEMGYNPVYVGRIIQLTLQEKGIRRDRSSDIMDEEIRFILSIP